MDASPVVAQRDFTLPGAGIALVVIGAFAPWVTAPGITSGGMDHDGKVTIFFAILGAVILGAAYMRKKAPSRIGLGIVAVLTIATAAIDIGDVKNTTVEGFFGSSVDFGVGWGLWLTMVGGIVIAAAVALRVFKR